MSIQGWQMPVLFMLLLLSKKMSRYCHSPVAIIGGSICVVMQKRSHFLISLLLLKIITWNSDYLCTIKRETHNSYAGVTLIFFDIVMPFFRLKIFTQIKLFFNISVFAEDISFKLGRVIYYQKREPIYRVGLSVCHPDPIGVIRGQPWGVAMFDIKLKISKRSETLYDLNRPH